MDNSSHIPQTVAFVFRQEWGKMVAVLTKLFGVGNLELAEDVVQDTLLKALHNWKINGLPDNPSAWVFAAARNKAIDLLRRQQLHHQFTSTMAPLLQSEYSLVPTVNHIISSETIDDDQLKMMFVCCDPALPASAQVAIILKTLCGFSVKEIAKAFVCSYDTVEKRLYRARQTLKENNISFELPPAGLLPQRIDNVLTAIYLLFNEGYNSTHHDALIRKDLMQEAIRLCEIISRSKLINPAVVHALLALMYFTAARNDARLDANGNLVLLSQQDRSKWNRQCIQQAIDHLGKSSAASQLSKYHLEASIAYEHCRAVSYASTNWQNILHYYDLLLQLQPSPIVALNRAIVLLEVDGASAAIEAIHAIPNLDLLDNYYLLSATLGDLHSRLNQHATARQHFIKALSLTQSPSEKILLQKRIADCNNY